MPQAFGLWPEVVAIAADAEMYCVSCAKVLYGEEPIEAVVAGEPGYEQYTDHEGNPFTVVLRGSESLHTTHCGAVACRVPLCDEGCSCYLDPEQWNQYGTLPERGNVVRG
ncbi:hypothetical protein KSC_076960 [Ktedonobacter sp. SOSP1-52]|uniref:hypothetical protein n=1 Tax=Ktedonobacter sp. SOSP1-52 TaxID=2778366 RepID=UPI00191507E2|nr:hypothetical protein [Ktedonobacter sp. SOSP1-52]GHO68804.1 hypothetical protein KSC_076960 [Ktedonobacter sp. SOSP1-52]